MTKSNGSNISVQSRASMKKLAALLGPEALMDDSELDAESRLYTTKSATSTSSTRDESVATEESDSDNDDESVFEDAGIMADFMLADEVMSALPITESSPIPEPVMDKKIVELQTPISIPSSPDIEALSVAQFPAAEPLQKIPAFQSSSQILGEAPSRTPTPSSTVDFEEVCERLRDSLTLPEENSQATTQDFETCKEDSTTSPSSSQSSTRLFTEPPTPALSSSASSLSSVSGDEKMARTKSSLVADQAALEAKFRLAAARDALKKVKSNVVAPSVPDPRLFVEQARPATRRSLTTIAPSMVKSPSLSSIASLRSSQSSTSINELGATNSLTSKPSRSSRARDNRPLTASKSSIKIGVAAPKNLSMMRSVSSGNIPNQLGPDQKRTSGFMTKGKGKASVYVPQNHITSIHEVIA